MKSLGDVLSVMVTCGESWPSVHAELVHRYDPGTIAEARRVARARDLETTVQAEPPASDGHGLVEGRAVEGGAAGGWDLTGRNWEAIVDAWAADLGGGVVPGAEGVPGTGGGGTASLVPAGPAPSGAAASAPFVPAPPAHVENATDPVVRRGRLLAADGRLRIEWPDEDEVTVVVDERWRRRRGEAVSGTGTVGVPAASSSGGPGLVVREQVLVRPWLALSWLRPRLVGPVFISGRPSTRLAAVPRHCPRPLTLAGLTDGAQRFDLIVDDETGVLVELAAYYDGRLAERRALRHLTVGDTPDPRLFDLAALG